MSGEIKDRVRAQFGSSADAYATSHVHAKGESLAILVDLIHPHSRWVALDVGTGAGHTAMAFAPHVAHVIASDLTAAMVAKVSELATARGLTNIEPKIADAEALPFDDACFDLVTCRLAFHHFPHPLQALQEFGRVLKPRGLLGLTDNITVEDAQAADYHNHYERLRDPSHHRVYSFPQLLNMIQKAGFQVITTREFSKEFEFHDWTDRQHVSNPDKAKLLQMMRTLPALLGPLFTPRWTDDTMYFSLREVVIITQK